MVEYPHIIDGFVEFGVSGFPIVGGRPDNVLDNFEDQSLSEYGDTSGWKVQGENVLRGRYSLESTAADVTLGDDGADLPTPRQNPPIEYSGRTLHGDPGRAAMLVNVQSEDYPWRNCYGVMLDTAEQQLHLIKNVNGETTNMETIRGANHPRVGEEYRAAITTSAAGVNAALFGRSGVKIMQTESYRDTDHQGGGLGWDNWDGVVTYFDEATFRPGAMGEIETSRVYIDSFESGNLVDYYHFPESGSAEATPTAAYRGNYGLEMEGYQEIGSRPGSSLQGYGVGGYGESYGVGPVVERALDNYPQSGEPILIRTNFRVTGNQQYWVPFAMEDETVKNNRYRLEFLMNGGFRVRKVVNGDANTLTGDSSEGRDYAALYDLSHSSDTWYSAILMVDQNEGIYAEILDRDQNTKGWVSSTDTEFLTDTNGIGFRCSGSGHVYFDEVFVIDQEYLNAVGRSEPIPHSDVTNVSM